MIMKDGVKEQNGFTTTTDSKIKSTHGGGDFLYNIVAQYRTDLGLLVNK